MCVHRVCVAGELPLKWTVQSQQQLCVLVKCSSRGAKNFINPLDFHFIIAYNGISWNIWKLKCYRRSFTLRMNKSRFSFKTDVVSLNLYACVPPTSSFLVESR